MLRLKHCLLILGLCSFYVTASTSADGFIKKEVYSFKDAKGNLVFTDRQPSKQTPYKTSTIEAANSTADQQYNVVSQNHIAQNTYVKNIVVPQQTVRIIIEEDQRSKRKSYKKKRSPKRCKTYKKKFNYFSDKMKSGYKNSEYKKLESNRKKYQRLLFNHCETKTFSD